MKKIEIKKLGIFMMDGQFAILVEDGKTFLIVLDNCFSPQNAYKTFEHDCDECYFLGGDYDDGKQYDTYFCRQAFAHNGYPGLPTVIARYGNEPSEYLSGLGFPGILGDVEWHAKRLGLLSE